ncbi:MAG: hypothetical protein ACLFM0_07365 [Spirochaetales bacterium]
MARSIEEILKDGEFQWRRVFSNAGSYASGSWLTLAVLTAVWYVLPHPLLLQLPAGGEGASTAEVVVWFIGIGLLWFLAATGFRLSYARFASSRPDLPDSGNESSPDAAGRTNSSRAVLRYAGVLVYVTAVVLATAGVVLTLLGLMILPASRVDGAALFSGYVAPVALALVVVLLRIRYAIPIETVLQHGEGVREGVRRGVTLFRERRLVVAGMTALVHLFWIPELIVEGMATEAVYLLESARVVSAVIRSSALVLWLAWYHEARQTEGELE